MSQPESYLKSVGLATEGVVPDVNVAINATSSDLESHKRLDFANAHGSWKGCDVELYDVANVNQISGKAFLVKINGSQWLMPMSRFSYGVVRAPYNVTIWSQPPNGKAHGDDPPDIKFYCQATMLVPASFQWQLKIAGTDYWQTVIVFPYRYQRPKCDFKFVETTLTNDDTTDVWGVGPLNPVSTDLIDPKPYGVRTITAMTKIRIGPKDLAWSDKPAKIRCRVSNAEAGGGTTYSPEMQLDFKDTTSSWF